MKLVIIESPLAGDVEENRRYASECVRDCLLRGEAPYASHLPGILDDLIPAERELGIAAGLAWGEKADLTAVYMDRGVSPGMKRGIEAAERLGRPIEHRTIKQDQRAVRDETDAQRYTRQAWEHALAKKGTVDE
jgi:hypothetical protein